MTENDWNSCTDPQPMLEFLRGKATKRKVQLYARSTFWLGVRNIVSNLKTGFGLGQYTAGSTGATQAQLGRNELVNRQMTDRLRCIYGLLPFRPVTLDPIWLTPTVVSLAQAIYDDRAFDRMPILADALEEAGCTDASILEHCRSGGEHVRGCWAVDLVLGKE